MFNYKNLIQDCAINQGYCLGLEAFHRLKGSLDHANFYLNLASDFNKVAVKLKNRALKQGLNLNREELTSLIYSGLKQGKQEASENVKCC
jgi:hypothetical protein